MLYALGAVAFEVWPLNTDAVERRADTQFVPKPVLGRRPPLEFVGEGAETIRMSGRLFPQKLGGLAELELLDEQRRAGKAMPLMRGDGKPFGWFVIESLIERSSYLDQRGVGKVIEFDISLRRAERAPATSLSSLLTTLFR